MFVYVHQVARHLPLTRQIFARLIRKATEKKGKEKEKKRKKEREKKRGDRKGKIRANVAR